MATEEPKGYVVLRPYVQARFYGRRRVHFRLGSAGLRVSAEGRWLPRLIYELGRPVEFSELLNSFSEEDHPDIQHLISALISNGYVSVTAHPLVSVVLHRLVNADPIVGSENSDAGSPSTAAVFPLPTEFSPPLLKVLESRRSASVRSQVELELGHLGALCYAAQGERELSGGLRSRTVPSAGARYPLALYLAVAKGPFVGSFRYASAEHRLILLDSSLQSLSALANGQEVLADASALMLLVYDPAKNALQYGERGLQFALIESGHSAQNVCLAAASLGLGTRCIGALDFGIVRRVLMLPADSVPLYGVAIF